MGVVSVGEAGVGQVQRPAAVRLRVDGCELHVVNLRHNHRHGDGQPGACDVESAEQGVLPQQGPGLFQVEFKHNSWVV